MPVCHCDLSGKDEPEAVDAEANPAVYPDDGGWGAGVRDFSVHKQQRMRSQLVWNYADALGYGDRLAGASGQWLFCQSLGEQSDMVYQRAVSVLCAVLSGNGPGAEVEGFAGIFLYWNGASGMWD